MSDELAKLLKDVANRDLLKAEIETLEIKRNETLKLLQAEKQSYVAENHRLKDENSVLEKKIADSKTEIERQENKKIELQLHCEKERQKINDAYGNIEKQKKDMLSQKDELINLQTEAASKLVIIRQREEVIEEKEDKVDKQKAEIKEQQDVLVKLKADVETARNESKTAEANARKAIEEASKIKEINQNELQRIMGLLKDLDAKKAEREKLDKETQEKIALSDKKLTEIAERETKITKAVENIESREKQLEIDRKNLNIQKAEVELKEKLVKEKLATLGAK